MMNTKFYLLIIYHLFFAALSMTLIAAIEGYGTEMFVGALYFNLIYLTVGSVGNYLFYSILQRTYFDNETKLLVTHFSTCLLLMNILSFFLNNSCVTWTVIKGFFIGKDDSFWVALVIHALMLFCYLLSVFITRRVMKKYPSNKTTKVLN
jgi:hypothetical protein